jgi:hypothetical protein
MSNRFDNVAKALASGMPRRKVLKIFVGGAAAAVTTSAGSRYSAVQAQEEATVKLCFSHELNQMVPCSDLLDPCVNSTNPYCNYTEPLDPVVNIIRPPRHPKPVINIPIPSFVLPGVNQSHPKIVIPPNIERLPELIPWINWNFIPFNPRRRRR